MLDKQLAFAEFLGVKSIIVLNKTDLDNKKQFEEIKKDYEKEQDNDNINYDY